MCNEIAKDSLETFARSRSRGIQREMRIPGPSPLRIYGCTNEMRPDRARAPTPSGTPQEYVNIQFVS